MVYELSYVKVLAPVVIWTLVPIIMIVFFPWKNRAEQKRLLPLLWLSVCWIVEFIWIWIFQLPDGSVLKNPDWVFAPIVIIAAVMLALSVYFIYRLKGLRIFTVMVVGVNAWVFMLLSFVGAMALSGSYL